MGDELWRKMLDRHDHLTKQLVNNYRGNLIKNTGDGVLAVFDGPARAVHCAYRLVTEVKEIGLCIRAGLHVGEIIFRSDDIAGITVNIAARVMSKASQNEVLLTRTVMELTGGSGINFACAGKYELKGLSTEFELFRPVV